MTNYDEDYRFTENLKRQKEEEASWVRQRREDYEARQESIRRHPPDEDEWNK